MKGLGQSLGFMAEGLWCFCFSLNVAGFKT